MEGVERLDHALPRRAAVVVAIGHADHFEPRPVVPLEQLRCQVGEGMLAKISRQVGDLDLVLTPGRLAPERRRRHRDLLANVILGADGMEAHLVGDIQEHERRQDHAGFDAR